MALTSGEKQNKATVSSIQSRMGVTPTYSEDAIGLAAKNASAVLDVFAEREANKEEVAWKTDFKLKTRETLTNYSRKHYDDPDAFTNAVNSYKDTLVNTTPNRFKNYAKEYIGNLAFQYGDRIWQEAQNQKDLLILDNFLTNHNDFIANRNQAIMGLNKDEMQSYWTESLIPEMSDSDVDYAKFFNSYPAAIQEQLAKQYGTPDSVDENGNLVEGTFNKTLAIGFETQSLISIAKKELEFAQAKDTALMQNLGYIPENYITEVDKLNSELKKRGLNYIEDPLNERDDASVYKNTNREERAVIVSTVNDYIKEWNSANDKNVKKQEVLLNQNKIDLVDGQVTRIKDGSVFENDNTIREFATKNGLNADQLNTLIKENTKMQLIQEVSSQISIFESGKVVSKMSGFDVNQLINSRVRQFNNYFGEGTITQNELKDEAMMQQMYELISVEFPDMTRTVFNGLDLSSVDQNGIEQNNLFLTSLVELSKTYGAVPSKLEQYFGNAGTLNFEQPNDVLELRNMAKFANNLNLIKGRPLAFDDSEANFVFPYLVELNKEFEKMGRLDAKLANLSEKEIKDILGVNTIGKYQALVVENWIGQIYPEQTVLDNKIQYIDQYMEENNLDYTKLMEDFFEDEQEDGPWWGFGVLDTDLLTGNNEVNLFYRDNDLEPSFRLVMQEAGEMVKIRVASTFGNETYKGQITAKELKKRYKEQLPYILNTLRSAGYGYDENG